MNRISDSTDTLGLPPRSVPLLMRLQMVFGGTSNQLGWLFFGFGLLFFSAFGWYADLTSMIYFRGELAQVKGVITSSRNTGYVTGGSKRSKGRSIYEQHYSFTAADGKQYQGVSYEDINGSRSGYEALIEYRPSNPNISRVYGNRKNILPPLAILTAIFPLIGSLFIIKGVKQGIKANQLLENGRLEMGRLISKYPTNVRINKRAVYKMTFEFALPDQSKFQVTTKTHITELLENESQEPLLYEPNNPNNAIMIDNLPGQPCIDEAGNLQVKSAASALLSLIIPSLSAIANGMLILYKFY
jgi:hypothetical protein